MTRYPYLLFDADNTLFDFDEANAHAFRAVCDAFGLPFSQELFDRYEVINNATWERFDRGELTKDETVLKRFFAAFRFQQHEVIALVDAAYAADIGFIVAGI